MRVVALGGCGGMGRHAIRTALRFDFVEEIRIVDLDGSRARAFARQDDRLCAEQADVRDRDRLLELLRPADVVLATVGPYYEFGTLVLRAAIDAGCHYIDICDDWETTLEQLELNDEAEAAGLTAIIGAGASPGISNLLALHAMRQLDRVDIVLTGWGVGDANSVADKRLDGDSEGGAATDHLVQQTSGKIRLRKNGKWCDVRPLQKRVVEYPGIGSAVAFTLGHPEPITFPRYFPEIRDSANVMSLPPSAISLLRSIAHRVDRSTMTVGEGARYVERAEVGNLSLAELVLDGSRMLASEVVGRLARRKMLPGLFGFASGRRRGLAASVGVSLDGEIPGGMGPMTCIPTAVVLAMLGSGEIGKTGVFAPEACIDPDIFFSRLEPFVKRNSGGANPLLRVARSWVQ